VYDTATGKAVCTFGYEKLQSVQAVALSSDGEVRFSLSSEGNLRIEKVATGAPLKKH
jgi:hypothetical protein